MQISDKNREARGIALTALICAVLQLAIAPNVGLGNGRANLALVFAATVALTTGGGRAVLCGFLSLIHISEPTRPRPRSRMPSSA